MDENEDDGTGGGGSGGGESIGVAQQALTGCCCDITQGEGKPGACHDVGDPSQCNQGEVFTEGLCNPLPQATCSVPGVGDGGHGMVGSLEGLGLFLALAFCAGMRRRMK